MNYNYRDIVRFSFGPLIQEELDQFTTEWNGHRIRSNRTADAPSGVPNVMYSLPILFG